MAIAGEWDSHLFASDVKARHDMMVGLVETMRDSYIVASKDSYIVRHECAHG